MNTILSPTQAESLLKPSRLGLASVAGRKLIGAAHWMVAAARASFERSRQRRVLAQLDDRALWDVGLNRSHVAREVDKWFWQA